VRHAIEAPAAGEDANGGQPHFSGEIHEVGLVGLDEIRACLGVLPLFEAPDRVNTPTHPGARLDDGDFGARALE
jgi:hypothetical protein